MPLPTFAHDRSSEQDRIGDISWERILMATISAGVPRIDASCAETDDVEINNHVHNYVRAMALALADPEMRQRFQLITQAYDRLAGRGKDGEPRLSPEVARRMGSAGRPAYSFGPFQLFPSQRLLLAKDKKVQLGSRAFDILTVLVERAGKVVAKDELVARAWPNVFVEDSNLKTQVCGLRRSLDEAGAGGNYIVTIPGRGYNFVAQVNFADGMLPDGPDPWRANALDHPYGKAQPHGTAPMMSLPELTRVLEPCT